MDIMCYAQPVRAELCREYDALLSRRGLRDEGGWQLLCAVRDDGGRIAAAGVLAGRVIKQIAVSEAAEGEGAAAAVVSALVGEAYSRGITHLFLCTKPKNRAMFASLGFYPIAETEDALMMENRRDGIGSYIASLENPPGENGAVVCNCNPFTLGHRYLIEQAAQRCSWLHVFVLSESGAMFTPEQRLRLVKEGTGDIKNCLVHQSEEYLISRATFPAYFIKDEKRADEVRADLDIAIFGSRIAPPLGIKKRFVGTEPFCPVTNAYNDRLRALLPKYGIELIELERFEAISASRVRALIKEGKKEETRALVPASTHEEILRCFK